MTVSDELSSKTREVIIKEASLATFRQQVEAAAAEMQALRAEVVIVGNARDAAIQASQNQVHCTSNFLAVGVWPAALSKHAPRK